MTDAIAPRSEEFAAAENWCKAYFGSGGNAWPFSFALDSVWRSTLAQCNQQTHNRR